MRSLLVVGAGLFVVGFLTYGHFAGGQQPAAKFGIDKRVPWTTSKVIGSPEPPPPYKTERAFARLKFFEPLDISQPTGSDRFYVAERKGKIFSFENKAAVEQADL